MAIEISARSDYGTKNKQSVSSETPDNVDENGIRMEDHCEISSGRRRSFVCVADGHGSISHTPTVYLGGYESAVIATRTAIKNMSMPPAKRFERVQKALHHHSSSFVSSQSTTQLAGTYFVVDKSSPRTRQVYSMHGCTLSCLSVSGNRFQCSWVGDSSVLLYRRSSTSWITSNHDVTDVEEVKHVTSNGGARYGKSYVTFKLPNKEEYMLQMTRSMGHFGNDAIGHTPSVVDGNVEAGDVFVVATDGLWKYVSAPEVAAIITNAESVDDISMKLIDRAKKNRPTSRDNAYVAVIRIPERRSPSVFRYLQSALRRDSKRPPPGL